jgi:hypothetical protein
LIGPKAEPREFSETAAENPVEMPAEIDEKRRFRASFARIAPSPVRSEKYMIHQ